MKNLPLVIIGTPVYRRGAYVLDKFLANQKEIQDEYISSELVLTTSNEDFAAELEQSLASFGIKGRVLRHRSTRPDYARNRIWDIAAGREKLRQYFLSRPEADQLLFLDADMTFDPAVISILQKEIGDYDAVYSGYSLRKHGMGLGGAGCLLFKRKILEKIVIRCYEFTNGEVIAEDNLIEMDLLRSGRIRRGFFLSINHYQATGEALSVTPQPVGLTRSVMNNGLVRYILIKASVIARYNIPWHIKKFLTRR
ncbi:MAG: glycosyltransferase family 2 protein [Dehalococcoidales bacterium]|nr:glycosyltransferase family 2 protein [Dehalococcoidales bacterium]